MNEQRQLQRVGILGANGNLGGRKLLPTYEEYAKAGVEVYAGDIVDEGEVAKKYNSFAGYFDLRKEVDRDKLRELGHAAKFDFVYDATLPSARFINLMNWEGICHYLIGTKPFTAIDYFEALRPLMFLPANAPLREKLQQHDHYINKPGFDVVSSNIAAAHMKYGKFARISIFIVEQRTINDEIRNRGRAAALDEGILPDLNSHGIMCIQRLVPEGLVWEDGVGNFIRRTSRVIEPTACVRAQMKNALCHQNLDTAFIVEYRVLETLCMISDPSSEECVSDKINNIFYVLIVGAKGLRATPDIGRDLKAIEIAFQGQGQSTGIIDLETNTLNELLQSVPSIGVLDEELRKHRGINLPMFTLSQNWQDFVQNPDARKKLFQQPNLIWENMNLLSQTRAIARKGTMPTYNHNDLVHNFVNEHLSPAKGFRYFGYDEGSGWPMHEEPRHLMRGNDCPEPIP